MRDRCFEVLGVAGRPVCVLPQGIELGDDDAARTGQGPLVRDSGRAALHVPHGAVLALGAGYADIRKGFDLFLQVWRAMRDGPAPAFAIWAGGIDKLTQTYLGAEIAAAEATGTFRFLGHRDDVASLMAAADVFLGIM